MSHWSGCSGAAESRRGEVASILRGGAKNRQHSADSINVSNISGNPDYVIVLVALNKCSGVFLIFLGFKFLSIKRCNALRVMSEAVRWGKRVARINCISAGIIFTPLASEELNSAERGSFYRNMLDK
ncbi:hypothetical protein N6N73_22075 [Escherichia albertii]|nr:hypothetical protein [Escherichia albertii]MCU7268815.1 hypothetical protein [Escherichia albertii]MCU7287483.1 hypothetical protein [Escherichia albertii]MCU7325077.1 hypothetical protein [Escherichia albertii]